MITTPQIFTRIRRYVLGGFQFQMAIGAIGALEAGWSTCNDVNGDFVLFGSENIIMPQFDNSQMGVSFTSSKKTPARRDFGFVCVAGFVWTACVAEDSKSRWLQDSWITRMGFVMEFVIQL